LVNILGGGIHPVRVVLRALALSQLHQVTATKTPDWIVRYTFRQRPGAVPLLDHSQRQRIIAMVCADPPPGYARWTVRLVAQEAVKRKLVPRAGREAIRILLQDHDLQPWREKMWCIAELDDAYIDAMEDVLEVYERPLSAEEPVVCVDEKPVTLHHDVREPLPMKPGSVAKRDNEYKRAGTANVFCGIEPQAGVHFTKVTPTRSPPEFADFIQSIANHYPTAQTIHLVMDNLSSHTRKALTDRFGEEKGGRCGIGSPFTTHRYTEVG